MSGLQIWTDLLPHNQMHGRFIIDTLLRLGKLLNISHISISAGMNYDSFVCHLVSCGRGPTSQLRTLHCRLGRFDLLLEGGVLESSLKLDLLPLSYLCSIVMLYMFYLTMLL